MKNLLAALIYFVLIAAALYIVGTAEAQTTQPAVRPDVWVGVFSQPIGEMAKWKDRGINLLVRSECRDNQGKDTSDADQAKWESEADRLGLFFMTSPQPARIAEQATQRYRVAFMHDDEPNVNRPGFGSPTYPLPGWNWTDPAKLVERYKLCKAAAPNMPVQVTFAGMAVPGPVADRKLVPYIEVADWIFSDWYPMNSNFSRYPNSFVWDTMNRIKGWAGSKPQGVFIECGRIRNNAVGRAPTPDEMEEQINQSLKNGANAIVYFPQYVGPGFRYDNTSPECLARMLVINAKLNPRAPPTAEPAATRPTTQPTIADVNDKVDQLRREVDLIKSGMKTGSGN